MTHEGQEGVFFDSGGRRLLGTLFLARGDAPKPTAIVLHGVPGIEKNYDLCHSLRDRGWNSLIFHYRGCWGSGGSYDFRTLSEDAGAAIDYLCAAGREQVDSSRLALVGHSMGGYTALLVGGDERIGAVVAYGACTDPGEIPFGEPEIVDNFAPWLTGVTADELAGQWLEIARSRTPLDAAPDLGKPVLVLHGENDEVIPVEQARRLQDRLPTGVFDFHPEANHAFVWHRSWLVERIVTWLDEVLGATG